MVKMQYEFLSKRYDAMERTMEKEFKAVNRRFDVFDRKMTTWSLALMGLILMKGEFEYFSEKKEK